MIEVVGKIAEVIFMSEMLVFTGVLLFRKPKHKKGTQSLGVRSTKLVGIYLTVSAIGLLIVNHFVSYQSLANYYAGLGVDSGIFYLGVKALVN